ncbi:MAG: DinB family protein [Phycisphaerales bacterium]
MPQPEPLSFAERFRTWYAYERDCNTKALRMLDSVPLASRSSPHFARAVGKMAHLVAARHMWLHRLGAASDRPESWFPATTFADLPAAVGAVEQRWTSYLGGLTDADIASDFTCVGGDGRRYRWRLLDLLTQVFGHAWYHRGQIALLVKDLGGEPVDTDYIFWDRPSVVQEGSAP